MKQIGEHIFYQPPDPAYDQPCLYAIAGSSRTLMIDGGVSAPVARAFVQAVHQATGRSVAFVLVTHWHWDHTFGLAGVDAPVIACRNTAAHLKRMAGYDSWSDGALDTRVRSGEEVVNCAEYIRKTYPGEARGTIAIRQPDIVFEGMLDIDLGGLTCRAIPLPRVHTNDSVTIHVPEEGVLFLGDCTGQNSYDSPAHYSSPAVLELMAFIRGINASVIAESHAEPASPTEFWQYNGILETAARATLSGCHDRHALEDRLGREHGGLPRDEIAEIALFFHNGAQRLPKP